VVPADARGLAGRLSVLFGRDVEIVVRLNDAHRRLRVANERLWSGLAPDALRLIYDGAPAAGRSEIAALMGGPRVAGVSDRDAAVLGALAQAHWAIHRAFCDYQSAAEQRRQLAVDVGELAGRLSEVLCACGWSAEEVRGADVDELAGVVRG
jgi:hypothetical protein